MASNCMTYSRPAVDIVEDVKRMVLDYISVPSDLQALCLVSKSWNRVATAYLYRNVVLDIQLEDSQFLRFGYCIQIGALRHLRHVRSLHLCDFAANFEVESRAEDGPSAEAESARQDAILRFLQLLPENKLTTFRYTCEAPFSAACIRQLDDHQASIWNIHITNSDPLQLLGHSRRSVTASLNNTKARTDGFAEFAKKLPTLESLSLQCSAGWGVDDAVYWQSVTDPLHGEKICTRRLTIHGCMPNGFTSNLPRLFDWSMVTCLSLFDGNGSLLFHGIATIPELCNLVHLQCCTVSTIQPEESRVLQRFLKRNQNLEHIQLGMVWLKHLPIRSLQLEADESSDSDMTGPMWLPHRKLRSLAWYDPLYDSSTPQVSTVGASLSLICHNLPRLQELGISAPLEAHDSAGIVSVDSLLQCLEPLSFLKELRMLHLYEMSGIRFDGNAISRPIVQTHFDIEVFANTLFQWAHLHCPQLEILAWGLYAKGDDINRLDVWRFDADDARHSPQLYFLKRKEVDPDHGERIFATSTTRCRIRDQFPELKLPNFDPAFSVLDRLAV